MTLADIFRRRPSIRVHILVRGRIGDGWYDVDEVLRLEPNATLADALAAGEKRGIPFGDILEASPHLRDTLMLNGERCPVTANRDRPLADGDEIYLLASIAGG